MSGKDSGRHPHEGIWRLVDRNPITSMYLFAVLMWTSILIIRTMITGVIQ